MKYKKKKTKGEIHEKSLTANFMQYAVHVDVVCNANQCALRDF